MTKRSSENPDDPRIPQVAEAIRKNPEIAAKTLYDAYGVSRPTLSKWVTQGWIPALKKPSISQRKRSPHWRYPKGYSPFSKRGTFDG